MNYGLWLLAALLLVICAALSAIDDVRGGYRTTYRAQLAVRLALVVVQAALLVTLLVLWLQAPGH